MKTIHWKPVAGYEGRYSVTGGGQVRNEKTGRVLRPGVNGGGYLCVVLCVGGETKTFPVQKLVAQTFLGPRPDGAHINHKNSIKIDNRAENLEYVTPQENAAHGVEFRRKQAEATHADKKIYFDGSKNLYEFVSPRQLTVDFIRHVFVSEGRRVRLSPKEKELLRALMEAGGAVLTRERLLESVWGHGKDIGIDTRTVDQHIARLRRKIGGGFVQSVPSYGYQFSPEAKTTHV